jgi:hypothetical protein
MAQATIWLGSAVLTGIVAVGLSSTCDTSDTRGVASLGLCVLTGALAGLAADPTRGSALRIAIFVVVTPVVGVSAVFLALIASFQSCS